MLEKDCYKKIDDGFKRCKLYRVENKIDPGMPDYNIQFCTGDAPWLEVKLTPNRNCKTKFRDAQLPWLEDCNEAGGCALIVIFIEDTKTVELYHGEEVRGLANKKLNCFEPIEVFSWAEMAELEAAIYLVAKIQRGALNHTDCVYLLENLPSLCRTIGLVAIDPDSNKTLH